MSYNLSAFAGSGAQFFDNNGNPLVGGLLYTYAAGTTTPLATATTSAGTVLNTNPIVMDAAGRTPNQIWVNDGVLYKFVLKTSDGTLLGTYDNVPSINDPTVFNDIITVTGTDTLLGTSVPPIGAYVTGATYSFIVANTNTGAVTISIDGLTAQAITYAGAVPLIAGQLVAGSIATIEYDGTRFQLMNSSAGVATVATLNVTGDATIGGYLALTGTSYLKLPVGTTAQRPTGATGMIRFNSTTGGYEGYNGSAWASIGGGATGGGSDTIFNLNSMTVTTNYSIPSGQNANSVGPITINTGITVTVPTGSRWVIL